MQNSMATRHARDGSHGQNRLILIVDSDVAHRAALHGHLRNLGYSTAGFSRGRDLLQICSPVPTAKTRDASGPVPEPSNEPPRFKADTAAPNAVRTSYQAQVCCIFTEYQVPDIHSLDLYRELNVRGVRIPCVVFAPHVRAIEVSLAMRSGVSLFLNKPILLPDLIAVFAALVQKAEPAVQPIDVRQLHERLAKLSVRERQVLVHLKTGMGYKVIASRLSMSPNTVRVHRANILEKLQFESVAELIRLVTIAESSGTS